MQSLLQRARTPPYGTPHALFRVAEPYLGKRESRSVVGISSGLAKSFSTSRTTSLNTQRFSPKSSQTPVTTPRPTLDLSPLIATTALRPYSSDSSNTPEVSNSDTASGDPKMYTASFAFFEAIWEAGVTHCFVNLGSDHPSIIEAMVKGQREKNGQFPRIITCPNEVWIAPANHHCA